MTVEAVVAADNSRCDNIGPVSTIGKIKAVWADVVNRQNVVRTRDTFLSARYAIASQRARYNVVGRGECSYGVPLSAMETRFNALRRAQIDSPAQVRRR